MKRLLVVDDDPDICQLLKVVLEAYRFKVDIATNGQEALEHVRAEVPDGIFLDLRMPVMDGRVLLAWLTEHRPALRNRLAFITGDTLGQGGDATLAELGRPILEKPFVSAEVPVTGGAPMVMSS